jgi:hypothetical protein
MGNVAGAIGMLRCTPSSVCWYGTLKATMWLSTDSAASMVSNVTAEDGFASTYYYYN